MLTPQSSQNVIHSYTGTVITPTQSALQSTVRSKQFYVSSPWVLSKLRPLDLWFYEAVHCLQLARKWRNLKQVKRGEFQTGQFVPESLEGNRTTRKNSTKFERPLTSSVPRIDLTGEPALASILPERVFTSIQPSPTTFRVLASSTTGVEDEITEAPTGTLKASDLILA